MKETTVDEKEAEVCLGDRRDLYLLLFVIHGFRVLK